MKTIAFAAEAKELNDLAKMRETSFRQFCVKLAETQEKVIAAGVVFNWWARDHLRSPATGKPWPPGTLKVYVTLGRKTDAQWQKIRARKIQSRGRRSLAGLGNRAVNEQVDILMIAWEQISDEARRIFLDQIAGRQVA
jgi:hypothetical protein